MKEVGSVMRFAVPRVPVKTVLKDHRMKDDTIIEIRRWGMSFYGRRNDGVIKGVEDKVAKRIDCDWDHNRVTIELVKEA